MCFVQKPARNTSPSTWPKFRLLYCSLSCHEYRWRIGSKWTMDPSVSVWFNMYQLSVNFMNDKPSSRTSSANSSDTWSLSWRQFKLFEAQNIAMNVPKGYRCIYLATQRDIGVYTWQCYILSNTSQFRSGVFKASIQFCCLESLLRWCEMPRGAATILKCRVQMMQPLPQACQKSCWRILPRCNLKNLKILCIFLNKKSWTSESLPRNQVFLCASFFRNAWLHFPNLLQSQWIVAMTVNTTFWNWNSGHLLPGDW